MHNAYEGDKKAKIDQNPLQKIFLNLNKDCYQSTKSAVHEVFMVYNVHASLVLSSRTDISLSTCRVKFHPDGDNCRQNNGRGNECSDVPTKIPNFDLMRWIIGTNGLVNSGGCRCTRLTARFSQLQSHLFEGLFYLYVVFYNVKCSF